MGLVVPGLKMMKKKKYSIFFHIISFMNSQNVDYYAFSTITMTLNTAKCGTQKQQDEIIMLIRILHLLCPNSAPIISNYIKLLQKKNGLYCAGKNS